MIVEIAVTGINLKDAGDFTRFEVAVRTDHPSAVLDAANAGRLVGDDHAAIRVGWLTDAAGDLARTDEWREGFEAMLAYAQRKGWTTESGEVLGHIVSST